MNKDAQCYFDAFKKMNDIDASIKAGAFQFGADADTLADLVISGEKTATCSLYKAYELENEPLPETGQLDVVLNSRNAPVAIIENTEVTIVPMNKVSEDFALAEGEGDKTYQYWRDAHIAFFSQYCKELGITFDTADLLVCERFKCMDIKKETQ